MKTKAILLTGLLSLTGWAGQLTIAQAPRGAVWVHGLGDDSSQWIHWRNLFDNERHLFDRNQLRNNDGTPSNYHSLDGVPAMANNVRSGTNGYGGTADNRSIYFGHSMGGVVGRDLDVNHTGDFGGIITAGSPLDGARIANTTRTGEAQNTIMDGVGRVISGPTAQGGVEFYLASNVAVDVTALLIFDVLDKFKLRDYGNQGGTDLQEGSSYLTGPVRNAQTATPKIHIYGNEEGPGVWRLVSKTTGHADDGYYVDVARIGGDVYEAAMWLNYTYGSICVIGLDFWQAAYFTFVAVAWSEGMNWWRYNSDRDWNHLIGADIPATRTVYYTDFNWQGFSDCMNQYAGQQATYEQYMQCQNQNTFPNSYTYYASQNGQSDAFIKAPSQAGYNSDWSNNATRIEALGVNHLEMKDHPAMEVIYNAIFDGLRGDPFFNTPR